MRSQTARSVPRQPDLPFVKRKKRKKRMPPEVRVEIRDWHSKPDRAHIWSESARAALGMPAEAGPADLPPDVPMDADESPRSLSGSSTDSEQRNMGYMDLDDDGT